MPHKKILGIDPGQTTGACFYRTSLPGQFSTHSLGPEEHHLELLTIVEEYKPDTIVCERFDYRRRNLNANLDSVEYIGILKLYEQTHPRVELIFQMQLKGQKGLWTDAKLKTLDLYKKASVHEMDAMRQVLYYLTITVGDPYWLNRWKDAKGQVG